MHIAGGSCTTSDNEFFLRAKPIVEMMAEREVKLGEGLGLIGDCVVDVHFSEWGSFPRLVHSMERSRSTYGFGIDEPACIEIIGGTRVKAHGKGRVYSVRRRDTMEFDVQILEPGSGITIEDSHDSFPLE